LKQVSTKEAIQFIEDGFFIARSVFPRELADPILPRLWSRLNIDPADPSTWTQSFMILKEIFSDEPIPQIFKNGYREIIDDLCGACRWEASNGMGYWPISFPNFSGDQWRSSEKWHLDYTADERCFNPSKLGLIAFHLFSDIAPGAGGTAIRIGSHKLVARILAQIGAQGMAKLEFSRLAVAATNHLPYLEATGQIGDVLFLHPLTVHSTSVNNSNRIRVLGHKLFHLSDQNRARKNLADRSLVDRAIEENVLSLEPQIGGLVDS
jgi:hypothetical protein